MDADQPILDGVGAHLDRVAPLLARFRRGAQAPGDARVDDAGEVAMVEIVEEDLQIVHLAAGLDGDRSGAAGAAGAADLSLVDVDELAEQARGLAVVSR